MNRHLIYGFAAVLFLGVLVAAFDRSQINALRAVFGFDPLYRSEALGIGDAGGAVAQVGAQPVPGILSDAPGLDRMAEAAGQCLADAGAPVAGPVAAALKRYLLALAATGLEREHPLVEPQLQGLHGLTGQGPMAAVETAREGRLTAGQRALLDVFHETYRNPDHPLYAGLDLYSGTLAGLNFQKSADRLAADWEATADCTVAETLPPLAEWERLAVE